MKKPQAHIPMPEPEPEPTWFDKHYILTVLAAAGALVIVGAGVRTTGGWAVDQVKHAVRIWQLPDRVDEQAFYKHQLQSVDHDLQNEANIRHSQVAELKARLAKLEPVIAVDTEPSIVITNAIIYGDKTVWTNVYHFDKNVK